MGAAKFVELTRGLFKAAKQLQVDETTVDAKHLKIIRNGIQALQKLDAKVCGSAYALRVASTSHLTRWPACCCQLRSSIFSWSTPFCHAVPSEFNVDTKRGYTRTHGRRDAKAQIESKALYAKSWSRTKWCDSPARKLTWTAFIMESRHSESKPWLGAEGA